MSATDTKPDEQPVGSPRPRRSGSHPAGARSGSTRAAARAYRRRDRRQRQVPSDRLRRIGSPVSAALSRLPFVMLSMILLASGIIGVLWLTTLSDEAGLEADRIRSAQTQQRQLVDALRQEVAALDATPRIAAEARRMGMVSAGDAAMLAIGADGKVRVIGTPTPVPTPPRAVVPAPTPAPTAAAPPTTARVAASPGTQPATPTRPTAARQPATPTRPTAARPPATPTRPTVSTQPVRASLTPATQPAPAGPTPATRPTAPAQSSAGATTARPTATATGVTAP